MTRAGDSLKRLARRGFRSSVVSGAARHLAALRGHSLVFVYHRITPRAVPHSTVVPSLTPEVFTRQIQVLGEIGRLVPLYELLGSDGVSGSPRFALTFDDDYRSHVESVLPALRSLGIAGTFFLSGRTLHGAGPYWFESLEELIASKGLRWVGKRLGIADADPHSLAVACERDARLRRIVVAESTEPSAHLRRADIEDLVRSGMTIGFHTLDHSVLPELEDTDLEQALLRGRNELAAVVGHQLSLFAYPHGRANLRTARMVRQAGYVAAWTGRARPLRRGDDRFLLGRWEPGPVPIDEFVANVSIRLNRAGR